MATPPCTCQPQLPNTEVAENIKSENYISLEVYKSGFLRGSDDGKFVGQFQFRVEGVATIEAVITRHPSNLFQIDLNNAEGSKIKMTVGLIIRVAKRPMPPIVQSPQQLAMSGAQRLKTLFTVVGQFQNVTATLGK
jgi:hypothetical protein